MATYGKKSSSKKSISSSQAKSVAQKAAAKGISKEKVWAAMKKLWISISDSPSSAKKTTATQTQKTTVSATPTQKTPDANTISLAQKAYNQRLSQWVPSEQAAIEISNKFKSAWFNTNWLNFSAPAQTTTTPTQVNNSSNADKSSAYATANPWSPNPYANDETSDIAMASSNKAATEAENKEASAIIKTPEVPVDPMNTGNPYTDTANREAEMAKDKQQQFNAGQFQKEYDALNQLENTNNEVVKNQSKIIKDRIANANETYNNINTAIGELQTKALQVFDQGAARQAYAIARQMADQWYINNAQLSQVANFAVADYRRNADLQRSTLEQEIQQKYIDAMKEKQSILDSIYQDASINENTKQQYAAQVNSIYNGITDNMTSAYNNIENQYNQTIQANLSPYISVEAGAQRAITQDKVQKDLEKINYQYAFSGPMERTQFILNYVNQNVDKNLAPYVMEQIRNAYKNPDFSTRQDLAQQVADIVWAAQSKYNAANTALAQSNGINSFISSNA